MKPAVIEVDLTRLWHNGVLMAANERFFWPLGLALTWEVEDESGDAVRLHVTQWDFGDGHHETIELGEADMIGIDRRGSFAAWLSDRRGRLPEGERAGLDAIAAWKRPETGR